MAGDTYRNTELGHYRRATYIPYTSRIYDSLSLYKEVSQRLYSLLMYEKIVTIADTELTPQTESYRSKTYHNYKEKREGKRERSLFVTVGALVAHTHRSFTTY